jgi:Mrp family chromosome partitioning ATPase
MNDGADTPTGDRSLPATTPGRGLTTCELEERRLIHRQESGRRHADAFRELRTRLLSLAGRSYAEGGNFVTLVAPVRPGCGGSYVARNLAAAFAFDETRQALLIDCDAMHPAQHEALGVGGERGGLIDYLENPGLPLEDVIYPTGVPRLQLIPSGRIRETPGESYSSLRMRAAIDALRAAQPNRQLLLDGSPVQGSPDARILSELADLVVLVVGEGQVASDAIDKAVASFPPEKLAGVVFNRLP